MTEPQVDEESPDDWDEQLVAADDNDAWTGVLAIVAFVLAVSSILTLGLMNGTAYVLPTLTSETPQSRQVTAALLGALLALVPVIIGWRASSRTLPSDPGWVFALARSAVVIGLLAGLMRLVVAVMLAANETAGFTRV